MNIRTKNGSISVFNPEKIIKAISKSAEHIDLILSHIEASKVAEEVKSNLEPGKTYDVGEIHNIVINSLRKLGHNSIADSYQKYRENRIERYKSWDKVSEEFSNILDPNVLDSKENANMDTSLVSTQRAMLAACASNEYCDKYYLTASELELSKRGDIYIHDKKDMPFNSFNCCLFDMATVLKDGFTMCELKYSEPKTALTALSVIGDITIQASAMQFGGFTIPELDKTLLPYVKKSIKVYKAQAQEFGIENVDKYVTDMVQRELDQGFQGLECKLNSLPCSRGDFSFVTVTFGEWDYNSLPKHDRFWLSAICKTIVRTRYEAKSGRPVLFPKLVYLYNEDLIANDPLAKEAFDECIVCSSKCLYPDYLSLTGNKGNNAVANEYLKHGTIISPMGCRAFLSHWDDPETNKAVTVGRCNIGAVSLHIPLLIKIAQKEFPMSWQKAFWNILEDRLEVIRRFFKRRYKLISETKASTNPMCFCQGGLYKGNLKPNDKIGDLTKYMTASFGVTALNEASILFTNKTIREDNTFANSVVMYIQSHIDRYKEEDGHLYALYGTPAESLMKTQIDQYVRYSGDTQFGSYFSNSFHCHVSEDINPFEKQDLEEELFHRVNGGHIQYCKLDKPANLKALAQIVIRGMEKGFYQGVNFSASFCQDCGHNFIGGTLSCPNCKSHNIVTIDRVTGYLGYSNINGTTRFNEGLQANLKDRKSM